MAEAYHEPVEIDEEGQIEQSTDVSPTPTEDWYDNAPPPPLIKTPTDGSTRKKKVAIIAVGVAVCAAIGLGLGFGLTGNNNGNNTSSNSSNNANGSDEVSTATTTSSTSTTKATMGSTSTESAATETISTSSGEDLIPAMTTTTTTKATMAMDPVDVVAATNATESVAATATTTTTTTTTAAPVAPTQIKVAEVQVVEDEKMEEEVQEQEELLPTETVIVCHLCPLFIQFDAVIIGAGWAGIRATETLLNSGIESILVLEASNYIGGRAKSINLDDTINDPDTESSNIPFDVGCEWLYNTGSEMEETLKARGFLNTAWNNDKYTAIPLETGQFYQQSSDGTTEILEDVDEWMDEIWGGFLQFRENRLDELTGLSYAEAIDKYIDKWGWDDDESLQFLNLMEDASEIEYTGDSTQLDIEEIEFFPPGYSVKTHYTSIPGMGFGNIAARYAEPFKSFIQLNSKVTEINSEEEGDGDYKTIVKYVEDGVNKVVEAKTVLVTVSLGVLKAGNINFVPSLPAWKQESIDAMGFGLVNKCIMSWNNDDDHVWPRDKLWFLLMTPEDETSGQWTTFFNPSRFKGIPTLTAWVGGDEAIDAEKRSDNEILSTVMNNLRSMFPSIREPDRVIISRWGMDENIRGTYSFPVPGRDFYDDADNLQRRVGRVWFAGEATGSGWATTMGAWNTGEEQALNMARSLEDV